MADNSFFDKSVLDDLVQQKTFWDCDRLPTDK